MLPARLAIDYRHDGVYNSHHMQTVGTQTIFQMKFLIILYLNLIKIVHVC